MDYMRYNYVLRPGDKVHPKNRTPRLGEYDKWAIEWGYRIFPGNSEEERAENRRKWLERTIQDPAHQMAGSYDVRSQMEDLGNDHVAFNAQGIDNMRYLCGKKEIWKANSLNALRVLRGRQEMMCLSYMNWVKQVLAHVGGRYHRRDDGGKAVWELESPQYCHRVVDFLARYVLQPQEWLFDAGRLRPMGGAMLEKPLTKLIWPWCDKS